MADIQVRCINQSDRPNPDERILFIGGTSADGSLWKLSQQEAIAEMECGRWRFFVGRPGQDSVWLVVAVSPLGNKYVKTEADGEQPNHLLSLPECP